MDGGRGSFSPGVVDTRRRAGTNVRVREKYHNGCPDLAGCFYLVAAQGFPNRRTACMGSVTWLKRCRLRRSWQPLERRKPRGARRVPPHRRRRLRPLLALRTHPLRRKLLARLLLLPAAKLRPAARA